MRASYCWGPAWLHYEARTPADARLVRRYEPHTSLVSRTSLACDQVARMRGACEARSAAVQPWRTVNESVCAVRASTQCGVCITRALKPLDTPVWHGPIGFGGEPVTGPTGLRGVGGGAVG